MTLTKLAAVKDLYRDTVHEAARDDQVWAAMEAAQKVLVDKTQQACTNYTRLLQMHVSPLSHL